MPGSDRAAAAIVEVGLATAQGGVDDIIAGQTPAAAAPVVWDSPDGAVCRVYRPARGIDPRAPGPRRFAALARAALADCFGRRWPERGTPLLVASCNGSADRWDAEGWLASFDVSTALVDTPWAGARLPVFSAACASGLHALFMASRLIAAGQREVVVLALDIHSRPSHDAFDTLRVLSSRWEYPWYRGATGFVPGEAAVAFHLVASQLAHDAPILGGPTLGHDLPDDDGLVRVLASALAPTPRIVLGQGTGPYPVDMKELAAIAQRIAADVPLSSPLHHFGHTLGASGTLSIALAVLAARTDIPRALALPAERASDGRPLLTGAVAARTALVLCRALGGACAAATIGGAPSPRARSDRWLRAAPPGPLADPTLRRIAAAAADHRPVRPPDLLLVHLEAPLVPAPSRGRSARIPPHAILEMTPGFIPQLIARAWGHPGPALCAVGDATARPEIARMVRACKEASMTVHTVAISGTAEDRHVEWSA